MHYPTILYYFGPVVNMWTMRYESRHRDIKGNAQATSSHINLLKTIAIKQVLKFCQTVDNFEQNQGNLTLFPDRKLDNVQNIVKKNAIEFKVGSFIILSVRDSEAEFGKIIKIEKVVETGEPEGSTNKRKLAEKIILTIQGFQEIYFNTHLHLYIAERVLALDQTVCITDLPIKSPLTAIRCNTDDLYYIILKFIL